MTRAGFSRRHKTGAKEFFSKLFSRRHKTGARSFSSRFRRRYASRYKFLAPVLPKRRQYPTILHATVLLSFSGSLPGDITPRQVFLVRSHHLSQESEGQRLGVNSFTLTADRTVLSFAEPGREVKTANACRSADLAAGSQTAAATGSCAVVTPPQPAGGRNNLLIATVAIALIVVAAGAAWFLLRPAPGQAPVVSVAPTKPVPTPPQSTDSDESNVQPPIATNPPAKTQPPAQNPDNRQHPRTSDTNNQPRPDTTARVTPPPVRQQPAAPTDLSGHWQGFYFDKASQAKTTVRLSIREVDGGRITGSLVFQTSDNTTGQCDLNGSSYQGGTLRLLTHCVPKVVPYLNTYTTFQGVAPTANQLSNGKVFAAKDVVASLQRN
jgi:hypothetical protein